MANEYDDLINEFGSTGAKKPVEIATPYHDLINEFGSGNTVKAVPQIAQDVSGSSHFPKPNQPITGNTTGFGDLPVIQDLKKAPAYVINKSIEGFNEGKATASKGINEIATNKSASGVGNFALGTLQEGLNLTGLPALASGATKFLGKAIGNKQAAETAEFVGTSGLPILKAGKVLGSAMPSTRALDTLISNVGVENIPSVIKQLKSNPRLTLMDVDPNAKIIAQGLASEPGKPRDILDKIVKTRQDTQLDTVVGALDEAMDAPVSVKQKMDTLKSNIKKVGQEINPIVANTKPVDISPVVADIDTKLKPGINSVITAGEPLPLGDMEKTLSKVRDFISDDKSFRTDPQSLHIFQSALRSKAEDLLNSSSGQDRQLGYALMNVRNQVVNAIDKASPQVMDAAGNQVGTYKTALSKYRDENDISDAFKKGQLITKNRLGQLDDNPEYWAEWVSKATPQELEAAREGARLAFAHQMGSMRFSARKGMEIPEVPFNTEKLKLLFGNKEVEKMNDALKDERKIADTNTKLFQNSQTAMRLLGAKATEVRQDYKPNFTKTILPAALEAGGQYRSEEH